MPVTIHPNSSMGTVHLTVADLGRSLDYYQHGIGLALHRQEGNIAALDAGGPDLLILTEQPGARPARGVTGLYHFALLLPSRLELARTLKHLLDSHTPIGGASDHAVSEALYLTDLDGNGIEIYRDRRRDEWQRVNGQIQIVTRPLDLGGVLGELDSQDASWQGLHPQTRMGHVHLHVSDLQQAVDFYTQTLGFDFIAYYGDSAGFVSAGGYHYHLGLNTWAGVGAPPPSPDAARLLWYTIQSPNATALAQLVQHIRATGYPVEEHGNDSFLHDPAENGIRLTVQT
ncbi:MAG: VOC family protein [Anaerolineae bacterium]